MLKDAQDGAEGQGAEDTAWPQSSPDSDPIRQDVNVRNRILLLPCSCPDTKSLVVDMKLSWPLRPLIQRTGLDWPGNIT